MAREAAGALPRSKRDVHEILAVEGDHPLSDHFDLFIMALIAANVLAVMFATVDALYAAHRSLFRAVELVSVAVFTVEYAGRLWSCTAAPEYEAPVSGRLRYGTHPLLVVDLLAIVPFYLGTFFIDTRFLRAVRLVRFFRLFKLARYSAAMQSFGDVAREKKEDLTIAVSATAILLVVASSMMYFAEHGAQPEAFSSIPETLWWGIITLTTVGYGDVYPVTPAGRLLGGVIALLGVGLVALPSGILASGFMGRQDGESGRCPHCGEHVDELAPRAERSDADRHPEAEQDGVRRET